MQKKLIKPRCKVDIDNSLDNQFVCFETDKIPACCNAGKSVYIYILVVKGWIMISLGNKQMKVSCRNMIVGIPGIEHDVIEISRDYRSMVLCVSSDFATDNNMQRQILQTSYFPIVHLQSPVLELSSKQFFSMNLNYHAILDHLNADHPYKRQAVQTCYSLFLIDLMAVERGLSEVSRVSGHEEYVFISFIRDLRENFLVHHNLDFYALKQNMTKTYLSRIVKRVTGHTVLDFIYKMLLVEACSMLRYTDKSIFEISEHLNFSDQASFSKFFSRLKGVPPLKYRCQHKM